MGQFTKEFFNIEFFIKLGDIMALFKCKQTNNTVEFENDWDIVQMRAHPDYEEVKEEEVKPIEKPAKKSTAKTEEE